MKSIYYLIPRFIREQYNDSIWFYINLFKSIKNKYIKNHYILTNKIEKLNIKFKLLYKIENRSSTINEITIYDKLNKKTIIPRLFNKVLDIKIYNFEKITIIGSTDALINDDYLYHQELLAIKEHHDLKRWDIFIDFDKKNKNLISLNNTTTTIYNDKDSIYITLLKEHSINYYHWITENIPRLILIIKELLKDNKILQNKSVILFVDNGMPKQCKEIIDIIMPFEYKVIEIKNGEQCACTNLIYCSPLWQSLDNTSGALNNKEFFIDKYALELVYKVIHEKLKLDLKPAFRKIYLRRRPTQMRSILNNDNVEKYMKLNNFEIIEIDTMSFEEQVRLFNEAKIVVGASGATFTNILFMQAKSKAIIFFPSHPSVNYGIFQPLADTSKINFIHYHTIPQDMNSIHSNFMVDLNKISFLLKG